MSDTNNYQAPAVQKAFQILQTIAESKTDLSLSEIAKNLGFSKSSTHGLIQALLKIEALEISPKRKKVLLGPAIVNLAFKSWNYLQISEQAQPFLDGLRDSIEETVFLGALSKTRGTIMSTAETTKPLKISSPLGTTINLLSGAVGKVFLAQMDNKHAIKIINEYGLPHFTAKSITNINDYIMELQRVQRVGYALDNEEYITGVKAVAVALGNHRGLPLALWTVGFSSSMSDDKMPYIIEQTLETARKLKIVMDSR